MQLALNADVGEGFGRYVAGDDAALVPLIGSASIACGMHAGDPSVMAASIALARRHGASIGAHPGYDDRAGFGRRVLRMSAQALQELVLYQIGALQALARAQGARVTHVKPHGALNNLAHDDAETARALARAIHAADPTLIFCANAGSQMASAGAECGLRVASEAYADRRYGERGTLLPRSRSDAVIRSPEEALDHVLRMLDARALIGMDGERTPAVIHTLCIHGDEPTAVPIARALAEGLPRHGVRLCTLPDLFAGLPADPYP